MLLGLRHGNDQDAVVERGPHIIVLNPRRELEAPRELADAALRDPVLVLRLLLLWWFLRSGRSSGGRRRRELHGGASRCRNRGSCRGGRGAALLDIILDGSVERRSSLVLAGGSLLAFPGNGIARLIRVLDEAGGWRSTGGVGALDAASDHDGLRVRELDVHLVLLDARQLAVQLEVRVGLLQVEPRREGGDLLVLVLTAEGTATTMVPVLLLATTPGLRGGVVVELVDEPEESREVGLGLRVEARSEHGHFAGGGVVVQGVVCGRRHGLAEDGVLVGGSAQDL